MKKTLTLRSERLAEISPLTGDDLVAVVGASGLTCTDLPPTLDLNTCHSFPNC